MPTYELTAIFKGGRVNYSNPATWACLKFDSCSNGKKVTSVHWRLPANHYGTLYVSDKCDAGGQYHYITDMNDHFATQKLKTARAFRSMMVRETLDTTKQPSVAYTSRCSLTSDDKERASIDGSFDIVNESSNVSSGNLSSNWYDALPSTSLPLKNDSSFNNDTVIV